MAENEPQESCITRIKKWFIAFYKAPCFWPKIIPLLILIVLAAFGLYQIVTSAFHYFNEPLSYFDPERLGQLGDFLGGTLNPIFGFATVCLLLWSVFIQKRELKESVATLKSQVKLSTNEYNRKQLDELFNRKTQEYINLRNLSFTPIIIIKATDSEENKEYLFSTIEELIASERVRSPTLGSFTPNNMKDIIEPSVISHELIQRRNTFLYFKEITKEIINIQIELLKITNIHSIKDHIKNQASEKARDAGRIHILDQMDVLDIIKNIQKNHAEDSS